MAVRRRKNFLPTVSLAFLSWLVVGFFVFFVDPKVIRDFLISFSYLPFFFFLFLSLFLTASLAFANSRRGLLIAIGLITFLYLRLFGLGHILNATLLFFFLLSLELAASNRRS
jgi:hypothetical protein